MATLANPSSPSCLQLRLGHRCRDSSLVPFEIRLRPSVGSAPPVSANGGGVRPRIPTSASPGSSSGWSESGDGGDSGKNDRFGGMLGAGLACVLFAAGVTFASLSLSTRTTRGAKLQMEPLRREQEVVLTSDDQGQDGKESNIVLVDNESKAIDISSESGTALQVTPGIVSAVVDQVQGQTLAALRVLKVIEADVQPGDLCTRREYARWLVSASSALSRL